MGFGATEILIIALILLLLFGASRLPQIGKSLGEGIRNFRGGIREGDTEAEEGDEKDQGQV